jgi:hypothetical protein
MLSRISRILRALKQDLAALAKSTCIAMLTSPDRRIGQPSVTLFVQDDSGLRSTSGLGGSNYRQEKVGARFALGTGAGCGCCVVLAHAIDQGDSSGCSDSEARSVSESTSWDSSERAPSGKSLKVRR